MSRKIRSLCIALCTFSIVFVASTSPLHVEAATSKKSISSVKSQPKSNKVVNTACTIKGNISSTKEKIYHIVGCPNYNQTVIDVLKGEMMFCSEAEAKIAGWRKALNCPK